MEKQEIFILTACGGEYEDKWESLIGAYSTFENAVQSAKEVVDRYEPIESELPMTFDEYERCNYGYRDCPDSGYDYDNPEEMEYYNELVERDGHSIEDFKKMEDAQSAKSYDFSFCTIENVFINERIKRSDKRYKHTYVSRGWDGERYRVD